MAVEDLFKRRKKPTPKLSITIPVASKQHTTMPGNTCMPQYLRMENCLAISNC